MDTIVALIALTCLLIMRKFKAEGLAVGRKGLCIALTVLTCVLGLLLTLICMAFFNDTFVVRMIIVHIGLYLISFVTYKIFISHAVKKQDAVIEDRFKTAIIILIVVLCILFVLKIYDAYQTAQAVAFWYAMH